TGTLGESARQRDPVPRNQLARQLFLAHVGSVVAAELANQLTLSVENLQRDDPLRLSWEEVIDNGTGGWVGTERLVRRNRSIGPGASRDPIRRGRMQQRHLFQVYRVDLTQWRDVIQNPDRPPVGTKNQVVV